MTQKIVIAKQGYNAETGTNLDNFIFHSEYNTLKYDISGHTSIQIVGDTTEKTTETTIAHNLGYVPFFVVYAYIDAIVGSETGYSIIPKYYNRPTDSPTVFREVEAFADSTNLYVRFRNKSSATYTATFYYKIFKNNLGL